MLETVARTDPLPPGRRSSLGSTIRLVLLTSLVTACVDESVTAPIGSTTAPSMTVAAAETQVEVRFAPGRVLVAFLPGADGSSIGASYEAILEREIGPRTWLASVPVGRELAVAEALSRNPLVGFAEPDYERVFGDPLCPSCSVPDDELFEWQWNMHNDGLIDLSSLFQITTGAVDADIDWLETYDYLGPAPSGAVRIGILDTGIRASHEDFCGKDVIWRDFYPSGSSTPFDDHGHGSHVSGISGGCANNGGSGFVGVAYGPNMEFVVGKVCAADGTCLSSAISEAIYWAVDTGANVLNMSFGDSSPSQAEAQALAYAATNNVLPVCAAGNDPAAPVLYPAADPNCVAVSATGWGDDLTSYSTSGPEVELSAPGGDLEDPLLGTSMIVSAWSRSDDDYVATAGTSMATPHVTGLAALLYSLGLTNASDIRACLGSTADDLGPAGRDDKFGYGRINMYQAVLAVSDCAGGGTGSPPPGTGGSVHVADLEGESVEGRGSRWQPRLTVFVVAEGGSAVSGADVTVSWSGDASGSATAPTDASGVATITGGSVKGSGQVTFIVVDIVSSVGVYDPSANTDPDPGEDGTSLTISGPTPEPPPPPPGGSVSASFTHSCSGLTCIFDGSGSTGTITTWEWDFGDGDSASGSSLVSHDYPGLGSYLVTLTVGDGQGASDGTSSTVTCVQRGKNVRCS